VNDDFPKAVSISARPRIREASWSAAVLCRFRLASNHENETQIDRRKKVIGWLDV
jgi:hypothetical protein